MNNNTLLSVIVPVYNEIAVIDVFYERLKSTIDSIEGMTHEIIFVDDGSKDGSSERLISLADSGSSIKVIKFSRNFGHQVAITAGIEIARGDAVVVIDADLQDPPEVIRNFIEKWKEGYDVVYGVREKREGEGKVKLLTAALFYRILKSIIKIEVPLDTGDFRLMSRRVVNHFKDLKETDRFVRGLVSWIGFRQSGVMYTRDRRYAGDTKYPYSKMLKFALDGITSFSNVPLKLATWLGYFTSLLAFLYLSTVFFQKIMGITVQGFATIMAGMLLLGGVQLICLGIIGEYIGRIFNETKQRPMYVIEDIYQSKGDS